MKKTTYAIIIMIALVFITITGVTLYSAATAVPYTTLYDTEVETVDLEETLGTDTAVWEEYSQPAGAAQDQIDNH